MILKYSLSEPASIGVLYVTFQGTANTAHQVWAVRSCSLGQVSCSHAGETLWFSVFWQQQPT